jgi:PleD family two-component response regulator
MRICEAEAVVAKKRVLIVDDSSTVRLLERVILGPIYDLVEAVDGEDALAKAAAERIDCVLLDVVMPKLDGFETCRRLRELETTRTIPIVIVTTHGEQSEVDKARSAGCTDYVTKPIDRQALLEKIRRLIGG